MKRSLQVEVAPLEPDPAFVARLAAVASLAAPARVRRRRMRATAIRAAFAGVALSCFGTTAWAAGTLPSPADLAGVGDHAPAHAAAGKQAGAPLAGSEPSAEAPTAFELPVTAPALTVPTGPTGPTTRPSGRAGAPAERRTTHQDRRPAETRVGSDVRHRSGADGRRHDGDGAPGHSAGHAAGDGHQNSPHQNSAHHGSSHRDGGRHGSQSAPGHGNGHQGGRSDRDHRPAGATRGDGHRHRR